jgi:hypothetical protein
MKRIALLSVVTLAVTLASGAADALSNRTFVSGTGNDANPCSLAAPCRSFTGALAQTNPGGEIAVLDTAGYGAVTITKAVSIVNEEGVEAGITATSGDGITINAGASDVVNLRGLTLVGAGGTNGITLNSAGALNIQNCVIRGFALAGINLVATGSVDFNVSNTIVSSNVEGVFLKPSGTGITVTASFDQVQAIHNSQDGFFIGGSFMTGSLLAIAADSLASGNGSAGFASFSSFAKAATTWTLANSKAANNGIGVHADGDNAAIVLNGSTISGNSFNGFSATSGGFVISYGNNAIVDTTNTGPLTPASLR